MNDEMHNPTADPVDARNRAILDLMETSADNMQQLIAEAKRLAAVPGADLAKLLAPPPHDPLAGLRISDDGTQVQWRGVDYHFHDGQQADIVLALVKARRSTPLGWMHKDDIARAIGPVGDGFNPIRVFKVKRPEQHAAVGVFVHTDGRGNWRVGNPAGTEGEQ